MYEDRSPNHHNRRSPGLASIVIREEKNWPTPTGSDWKGSGPTVIRKDGKDRRGDRLDYAVEQMKEVAPVETSNGLAPESMKMKGSLDPAFVEYLMGYPIGWTDLKGLEMQSFRR
jgi:hypothetical protein